MRPIEEQTILITGSTGGLGRETARALADRGATVLVHGRDRARGEATIVQIREETQNERVRLDLADFSRLDEVRGLAAKVAGETELLDVLVNNAGIARVGAERALSAD